MAEEAHHRVGCPRMSGCRLLPNRTNPDRADTFLNLAEVAVLDMLMILGDQQVSMLVNIRQRSLPTISPRSLRPRATLSCTVASAGTISAFRSAIEPRSHKKACT